MQALNARLAPLSPTMSRWRALLQPSASSAPPLASHPRMHQQSQQAWAHRPQNRARVMMKAILTTKRTRLKRRLIKLLLLSPSRRLKSHQYKQLLRARQRSSRRLSLPKRSPSKLKTHKRANQRMQGGRDKERSKISSRIKPKKQLPQPRKIHPLTRRTLRSPSFQTSKRVARTARSSLRTSTCFPNSQALRRHQKKLRHRLMRTQRHLRRVTASARSL